MDQRLRIFIYCLVFCLSFSLKAQREVLFKKSLINDPQTKFINLNSSNGLSNDYVTDIIQDRYGLMWITTREGLNSYDGIEFTKYYHNVDDSLTPQSNSVTSVDENINGDIFFGTKAGLCLFNRVDNNFKRISLKGSYFQDPNPYIRTIKSDGSGKLWIEVSEGALLLYDIAKDTIILNLSHMPTTQLYYSYSCIYYDSDSTLWVGGRNMNPMFLKHQTSELTAIRKDYYDINKKRENDVASFYEDSKGNFWVTAFDGVYLLDRETLIYRKFMRTSTWGVHEDAFGNIWFATGSGIMKYSSENEQMVLFSKEKDNPNSLASNSVHKVIEDYHGNLWFGTSNGLSIYSPTAYPFGSFTHIPGIDNSPEGIVVTAAAEDDKGNLWLGYEENGLDYFNTKNETFTHFKRKKNALAANEISCLYFDDKKRLWIGLWRGIGFNMYDTKSKKFSLYTLDAKTSTKDWYNDFIEDDRGTFYIGFWGSLGMMAFDVDNGLFGRTLMYKFPRKGDSRLITRFLKDSNGSIWYTTTRGGVHIYYPESDTSNSYFEDADENRGLFSNANEDICMDNDNNIWLIGQTLQKYVAESDTFISYGALHGLTSTNLVSLLPDNLGNIWVASSDKGLFRFSVDDEEFTRFTVEDGLQSNKFSKGRLKLSTGELLFGGNHGFNLFSPGHIIDQSVLPLPFFGKLRVDDRLINKNLNIVKAAIFQPEDKTIKLGLNLTDAVNPLRYTYQCKLEGYDKDWVEIDSKIREIRYSNVPPGTYKFNYRIGDGNRWSSEIAQTFFRFNQVFYKTWWFNTILIIMILIVIIAIVNQRIFDLNQKHKNLELQQRLFRLQMNPHFMFNSLLAIQNFVYKKEVKEAGLYIADFARLFRLILDNSRSEFVIFDKEIETLELYLKLQSLRYNDKFAFEILLDEDIETDMLMIPPMLAQPMIENAIEHGIFQKQGKGNITIKYKQFDKTIYFEVVDDGIGLAATKGKQKREGHKSSALDITKERLAVLAKKHKYFVIFELIEIKSKVGEVKGTKVSFHLPYRYQGDT